MPGIFGIVDRSTRYSDDRYREMTDMVERMAAAMQYEACYTVDIVCRPDMGVFVGRAGFAAGDPSDGSDNKSSLVVLTTGEPVVGGSATDSLQNSRVEGLGYGACELARLYREVGEDGLTVVSGGFAAFIIDALHDKCLLLNDRYGMERLFLHSDGARTIFSSEAKAILAVAARTRDFDPNGLADLLACGCTLGTRSLFRGIEVLESGTLVTFKGSDVIRRRYFLPSSLEQTEDLSEHQFIDGLCESLHSAVNDSVKRAPGAGISLTGGLDSRMIMASLDAPAGNIPCYTFGSMYRTTFDVSVGREVAKLCGQPHYVLELGEPFLDDIQQNLEQAVYISDGYIGLSGAAELYLNRMARSIAPARVTGNWGGELLRGVRAFKCTLPRGNFVQPDVVQRMGESAQAFSGTDRANPLSYVLFHQMPVQGYGRYAIERSQVRMRAPFLENDVVSSLYRAPGALRNAKQCSIALLKRRPELLTIPTDTGLLGTSIPAVRFVRRAYRRALVKAEYLTSHGAPNWIAALSASLPPGLVETRFQGRDKFQHFRVWMRRQLAGFVRDTLSRDNNSALQEWFDMGRVERMLNNHIDGRANYTEEIDKILTVAIAGRTLFKSQSLPSDRRAEVRALQTAVVSSN